MSDDPHHSESGTPSTMARFLRWDALAAIVASLVGLLALAVAGYTAYIQRQQVSAQVWPYLLWANSDNQTEYMWMNKGVGPAIVKSAQVLVDGKPQHNWAAVMRSLLLEPINYGQSTFNGNVLSAGETLDWLKFMDHASFQRFRDAARRAKLDFKVCYCSTLGDCWVNDTTKGNGNVRIPVGKCPAVPAPQQFDD
ncbi:MAG TPA: hypothetical protein VFY97_04140 [Rhodanobacteraceae bacterium]|nr:hypothetical protein [Rhodanobacteraceae bacterium]